MDDPVIIVAALGASATVGAAIVGWMQSRGSTKVDAYRAIAERLAVVEDRADDLPSVEAHLFLLETWAVGAHGWMTAIAEAWRQETGRVWLPPPPQPPPVFDRRGADYGPPGGIGERRRS